MIEYYLIYFFVRSLSLCVFHVTKLERQSNTKGHKRMCIQVYNLLELQLLDDQSITGTVPIVPSIHPWYIGLVNKLLTDVNWN
jgi:hypothetical protein